MPTFVLQTTSQMALSKEDLGAIEGIMEKALIPIKNDVADTKRDLSDVKKNVSDIKMDLSAVKKDVSLLAALNQLDEIRKDKRLSSLYAAGEA
jgi:archaellum component FlaC